MIKARLPSAGFFFPALFFLLLFFASRTLALEALPLHNDEGLHLTRAVEVWNGNPFWEIRDGKIINHWLIAAFYPQHAPVFVGRIATVFVSLLGFAVCMALTRRLGMSAVALGALLWLCSPFMFFYDRMAFSDAQAGALGLLALWAASSTSLTTANDGRGDPPGRPYAGSRRQEWYPYIHNPIGTAFMPSAASLRAGVPIGVLLALALLFKFTAAPYALGVALLVMSRAASLRDRLRTLATLLAVVAAAFVVPVVVLLSRGSSLFDIALAWVGAGGGGSGGITLIDNLARLGTLLMWGNPLWAAMLVVGWAGALGWMIAPGDIRRTRHASSLQHLVWVVASVIPMLAILLLGRDAQSRHFAAAMPSLVTIAAIGWGRLTQPSRPSKKTILPNIQGLFKVAQVILLLLLPFLFIPFAINAYRNPATLNMPPLMAQQYIEGYASGFGLREAVEAFPQTLTDRSLQVVASMYGDSCRRANFYAREGRQMLCGDAPMRDAIEAALTRDGAVYVLVERGGQIGIDVAIVDARATLLGVYPRPNETDDSASVRLWRLER